MGDEERIIEALELFNEKAAKLNRLSFIETMLKHKAGVTIKVQKRDDGLFDLIQERTGPLEEAIDAFVLTMRFFIQDNEPTSFRQLAQHYYRAPIDDSLKDRFRLTRTNINSYLDSNSALAIYVNDELLNHRKIMETVIYGGLSHANPNKKRLYKAWMGTPLKAMIENDFVCSLAVLYKAILAIKDLNLIAIDQIRAL